MASIKAIDGNMLEGGGQILRNASALSAITGCPLAVDHIRAKRSKPGLQPQHLTGLRLVERICGGVLEGGEVGSISIVLRPGRPRGGHFSADTKTAGSCTLMAQASMPVCVFAEHADGAERDGGTTASTSGRRTEASAAGAAPPGFSHLELRGGTDADMAPPVGYLTHVLAPLLRRLYGGLMDGLDVQLVRRGFYPRGGGIVTARIPSLPPSTPLPPIDLSSRGNITQIGILAFSAGRLPANVAKRLATSAESAVRRTLKALGPAGRGVPIMVEAGQEPPDRAVGDGCGVLIYADTDTGCRLGASAKGERGVPAEEIGERAAAELAEALTSGTCVDQWMQDQLIIWMALASGVSRMLCAEPTLHTRTAMVVAEQLLPGVKFVLHRPSSTSTGVEHPGSGTMGPDKGSGSGQAVAKEAASDGGGSGTDLGSLWLVECTGAGWTVGRLAEADIEGSCAPDDAGAS